MVEPRNPEREVGVIPRKRWLRPDMTEKVFTGMFSLNKTKNFSIHKLTSMKLLQHELPCLVEILLAEYFEQLQQLGRG